MIIDGGWRKLGPKEDECNRLKRCENLFASVLLSHESLQSLGSSISRFVPLTGQSIPRYTDSYGHTENFPNYTLMCSMDRLYQI